MERTIIKKDGNFSVVKIGEDYYVYRKRTIVYSALSLNSALYEMANRVYKEEDK